MKKATKKTKDLNLVISDDITAMANKKIKVDEIEPEIVFITAMANKKIKVDEIEPEIVLNDDIKAPIEQGQELGIIKYNVDGLEYKAKLLAETEVEVKTYYIEILIGLGIFIIVLCLFLIVRKKNKKQVNSIQMY